MKAKKIINNTFKPITLQVEISTEHELELLKHTVESIAPVDSTPASLNQMQYDFACSVLIMLRNAVLSAAGVEQEVK